MELLTVTTAELERLRVLQQVQDGVRTGRQAAVDLGLSERQLRRLRRRIEAGGAAAMVSRHRGKAPNNRIHDSIRATILERCRSDYRDFGPTFLAQTLHQREGISVSREWLRALLIKEHLWQNHRRKRNVHPLRARRTRFGELVQMDGSPHDWFEDRGPRCTLLLAIDDATSRVTAGHFEPAETSDGYFRLIRKHLETYGRFCAAYTDKHSIFRYSGHSTHLDTTTQVQRALDELAIELICANSPQAKGRVERANRTFQDRLIKAMRLEHLATMDAANSFLPRFISDHNERFANQPADPQTAHRSTEGFDLEHILCRREERVITKNLMFQLDDATFTLVDPYSRRNLATGSRVLIHLHLDRPISVYHQGRELIAESLGKLTRTAPIVSSKDLNAYLDRRTPDARKVRKPAANHPWKTPIRTPPSAA
jgi:hypothetical protein